MILLDKYRTWVSTEEIEVLKHNLNWSNWTDMYACKGKWKIEITDSEKPEEKINIYMPTSEWGQSHSGYWKIYSGNEEMLNGLNYSQMNLQFSVIIYERLITFERE